MAAPKNFTSLNILRILAGFFVIFIHTTDPFLLFPQYVDGLSWWIIYYFNTLSKTAVPIFIMISGYLLLNQNKVEKIGDFYKRRLRRVGTPLFLWVTIFFFWRYFWGKTNIDLGYIVKTLLTVDLGPLYFLVVILELYLIAPFILRLSKKGKIEAKMVIASLIFSMAIVAIPFYFFQNKFSVSQSIVTISIPYAFYFIAGGYFRSFDFKKYQRLGLLCLSLLLCFFTIHWAKGDFDGYYTSYFSPTIILMSVSIFLTVKGFEHRFEKGLSQKHKKIIQYIATTILGIFLIHPYILDIMRGYTKLTPGNIYSPLWLVILGIVVLVFLVCFGAVAMGKKIPVIRHLFE